MTKEIIDAVSALEKEKGIDGEILLTALEDALLAAYKKTPGAAQHAKVELDRDTGDIRVLALTLPEEDLLDHPGVTMPEFAGDEIAVTDVTPDNFGRIAAQTAKQVILQRIREAEREMMLEEYQDRLGDVVTGIVQQSDSRYTLVDLGRVEALLPGSEQVPGERYEHGARVKGVIIDVRTGTKGPQIVLSRRSEELIKELFELEVPEIADGLVVIRAVAREAGYRAKIAVESRVQGVDPVGACVRPRGP